MPRYPDGLREKGVSGEVLIQFIVDTVGRVEPGSILVLRSTHPDFVAAVRKVLPKQHYDPAEREGRKVRQFVQQPFLFEVP